MPKSVGKVSQGGPGAPAPVSVYDFLYHDSRRVGSFLAQLDQNGLLTEVRQGEHSSKGARRGFSASLGASTPLTGGGNVGFEVTPSEGGGETLERVYDPFWANARELLDALTANNMIHRNIATAPLGGVVLASGALSIIDLGLLQHAWKLDSVRRTALAGGTAEQVVPQGNREARRARGNQQRGRQDAEGPPSEVDLVLDLLTILPHSLHSLISGSNGSVWCNLKEEHLVGAGSDLVVKHGHRVPGEWNVLGIVDAQPDIDHLTGTLSLNDPADDILNGDAALLFNSLIGNVSRQMAPLIRLMLGRPANAYGVTPLLLFREVA